MIIQCVGQDIFKVLVFFNIVVMLDIDRWLMWYLALLLSW